MDTAIYLSLSRRDPGEAAGSWTTRARAEFFAEHDLVLLREEDRAWAPFSVRDLALLCGGGEQRVAVAPFPPLRVDPDKVVALLPRIVQARREDKLPVLQVDAHTLRTF